MTSWPRTGRQPPRTPAWRGDGAHTVVAELADHAIGCSRGGLTTKVNALADGRGRLLVVLLTAGNTHDTTMFAPLLAALRVARTGPGRPRTRPDYLVADKGYSSRANRRLLRARGIGHTIPEKADQAAHRQRRGSAGGRPPGFDPGRYARRNGIERGFCQLKHWRGWPLGMTSTPATTPARSPSPHC
ncbi:transposase [Geodermatophilus maliterrae]|uniref:Transposase n=1 Tax=Geodermatophilus maliterrae TaxID=3162531 RepID=A0ABV3XIC1_9ACTN